MYVHILLSFIYYSKCIIHGFCIPIIHYNNLEAKKINNQENRVVQAFSNVFSPLPTSVGSTV